VKGPPVGPVTLAASQSLGAFGWSFQQTWAVKSPGPDSELSSENVPRVAAAVAAPSTAVRLVLELTVWRSASAIVALPLEIGRAHV